MQTTQMQVKAPKLREKRHLHTERLVLFGLSYAPIILHQGMPTFAINIFFSYCGLTTFVLPVVFSRNASSGRFPLRFIFV